MYKLNKTSGVKRDDGRNIPEDPNNRDWKRYLLWVADGNTPAPYESPEEIVERELREEIRDLKEGLKSATVWQFRMIVEIWKVLKMHTPAMNSDIDPEVFVKATEWMQKLNRLKEIDE